MEMEKGDDRKGVSETVKTNKQLIFHHTSCEGMYKVMCMSFNS